MERIFHEGVWTIVATAVELRDRTGPDRWVARCSISKPGFDEALHQINGRFYSDPHEAVEDAHTCGQLAIAEKTIG